MKCSQFAPKQLTAIGCPDDAVQVLFVKPMLDADDVQYKQVMGSHAQFSVLNDAMQKAGFEDNWPRTMAQFTVPVRCAHWPDKEQKLYCRDLLWLADILQKRPKLIVTLGSVNVKRNNRKIKVSAFAEAFGTPPPGRGRVLTLREIVGDSFELQATLKPMIEGEVAKDGDDVSTVPVRVEVPDDIYVMDVTTLEECLLDPGMREFLNHDIAKIPKILNGTYMRKTSFEGREYRVVETFEEAVEVFKYFQSLDRFAYDIETGPHPYALDPYSKNSKILCMALADPWRRAWVIPWLHKDSWLKDRVPEMAEWLKWAVHGKQIDVWNGKFDNRWLLVKHGVQIQSNRDGMLDRGLIDENKDKRLKTWAEMHTDLGYYDEELQEYFTDEKGKSITDTKKCYESHVPFDVLLRYNCADADATMVLTLHYEKALHEMGLLGYSQTFTMPDVESTAQTEHAGVAVDWVHREAVGGMLKEKFAEVAKAIAEDPYVRKWEEYQAAECLRANKLFWHDGYIWSAYQAYLRGDTPLYSEEHQAGWDDATVQNLIGKKYLRKQKGKLVLPGTKKYTINDIRLNLNSPTELKQFIYGKQFIGLAVTERTEADQPSTDSGVLKNNAEKFPILGHIDDYRKLQKWKSTYFDPVCIGKYTTTNSKGKEVEKIGWVRDDNLVHAEFLLTGDDKGQITSGTGGGTVTGRKSCKTPNLQNQKSRGEGAKEIKKYFISKHRDEGGLILQADYSQLELRIFAVVAGIQWMIGRYQEDADLHAELATELFQLPLAEVYANDGFWRACAKEFWFGPIYGEGAQGIVDQLKNRHKIIWTKQQGEAALERMYGRMPEFGDWKALVMDSLSKTAEVRTVFGRRRFLPTFFSVEKWVRARAIRQAINFLIQSAGSDMTTYAWILLNWWARREKLRSRIVVSVHDSLVWDLVPQEKHLVMAGTKFAMENLPFSFVRNSPIRFKTEMEIGPSWGEIKGIEKLDEYAGVNYDQYDDTRLYSLRERCNSILF